MPKIESFLNKRVVLHGGDCLKVLAKLKPNSVDSVVTDPPYHLTSIVKRYAKGDSKTEKSLKLHGSQKASPYQRGARGFMGKKWDGGNIAFRVELWRAVHRVLKPGGYLVAFSSCRTFGRMSVAIEDAGFIVHPFIAWMFGQGFPKAHRVTASGLAELDRATGGWDGWRYGGQTLKPAIEPIFMGQKPFSKGMTGTQNVMRWGTGALNIDGCRVGDFVNNTPNGADRFNARNHELGYRPNAYQRGGTARPQGKDIRGANYGGGGEDKRSGLITGGSPLGRWPANVIHDGSDEVVSAFPDTNPSRAGEPRGAAAGDGWGMTRTGAEYDDSGSAARFFYSAKADADDRLGSKHPTVKPLDLKQWLVRLVTPPGGLVLDPFAGTGTTGEAAFREGASAVLIEMEADYRADIRRRMGLVLSGPDERSRASIKAKLEAEGKPLDMGPLFSGEVPA